MNVLYVNTSYSGGGAETVTRQLFEGLKKYGCNTYEVVNYSKIDYPDDVFVLYNSIAGKIYNRIVTFNHNGCSRHISCTINCIKKIIVEKRIDVVHLHNIHGNYFGIFDIDEIVELCPVVWTLHDMWAITGKCFFSGGCIGYKNYCVNCNRKSTRFEEKFFLDKSRAFNNRGIIFVTPSMWLKDLCKNSWLADEDIRVINNGVDLSNFIVHDKFDVRKKYGFPPEKKYILAVAANISEKRKGFDLLLSALSNIDNLNEYCVLLVGDVSKEALAMLPPEIDIRSLGYIREIKKLNEIYSAADVFVLPSQEDNFPCVTVEALASGTPVIAFNTGGIPEQVLNGSGWIASEKTAEALSKTIVSAFSDTEILRTASDNARNRAVEMYSDEVMFSKYFNLYNEAISRKKTSGLKGKK